MILISRHCTKGSSLPDPEIYTVANYEVPLVVVRPNARHCAIPKKMSMEL